MQARQEPDGSLILTYDGSAWSKGLLAAAIAFFAAALWFKLTGSRDTERLIGLLAGGGLCLAGSLGFFETAFVRIDPATQNITWRRRWALSSGRGNLPFSRVRNVIVESPTGTRRVPMQRITLRLTDGTYLPLTYGCRPDDGRLARAAMQLRKTLGQPEDLPFDAALEALVELGRAPEAVAQLIETAGLSRTDAETRVTEIKNRLGRHG